jgi:putative transposase
MSDLFLLSEAQMRRIEGYFPRSHGVAHVDNRRIVSAIVFVIKNGFAGAPRRDSMPAQDDLQSVHSLEPFGRVQQDFRRVGAHLRQAGADHDRPHTSEAHRTAASLLKKPVQALTAKLD